jgi:hypothetical protein
MSKTAATVVLAVTTFWVAIFLTLIIVAASHA